MSTAAAIPVPRQLASPTLTKELWVSLASLLRSHVAMHCVARPGADLWIVSSSDAEVVLHGPKGRLRLTAPRACNASTLAFRPLHAVLADEPIQVFFMEDSSIQFENLDRALDMEAAVEYLLRKVIG